MTITVTIATSFTYITAILLDHQRKLKKTTSRNKVHIQIKMKNMETDSVVSVYKYTHPSAETNSNIW